MININDCEGGYSTTKWRDAGPFKISMGHMNGTYTWDRYTACALSIELDGGYSGHCSTGSREFIDSLIAAEADGEKLERLCWAFVLSHMTAQMLQQWLDQQYKQGLCDGRNGLRNELRALMNARDY